MKYKKGMKFRSLINNSTRIRGKIYIVECDSNHECYYTGEDDSDCSVSDLSSIEFMKENQTEVDYLDSFQRNFKEGV